MPGAFARPQPRTQKKKAYERSHRRFARGTPAFPVRMVFNGFLRALPGEPGFLATVACKIITSTGLISASGYQDHTTSPSASGAFVFCAVRVHRIPHSTFVTIAKRPSCERGTTGVSW